MDIKVEDQSLSFEKSGRYFRVLLSFVISHEVNEGEREELILSSGSDLKDSSGRFWFVGVLNSAMVAMAAIAVAGTAAATGADAAATTAATTVAVVAGGTATARCVP
ncbi:hypothetical protein HZH68_011618 [Vespula germanica]|uniref:Uncharacterized protein n=1 Tax=Vespula germanica TaxID=30212 RepID=A0A834N179_VESGE|nr:hypothetical protein HZH68_011618 [Vespula germanica]